MKGEDKYLNLYGHNANFLFKQGAVTKIIMKKRLGLKREEKKISIGVLGCELVICTIYLIY